jgi:FecR protein
MTSQEDRSIPLRRFARLGVCAAVAFAWLAGPWSVAAGRAQDMGQAAPPQEIPRDDVPAHLAVVDGTVTIERDGQSRAAEVNLILLEGDRLRTDRAGRVEILFGDGSALDLDESTSVDLLSASLVRLRAGRLRLAITRLTNDVDYRVDAAGSSVEIHSAVDCLVSVADTRANLAVFRGTAELVNTYGRTAVRAGSGASATDAAPPSSASPYHVATSDEFDRWVDDQHQARVGSASTSYLPDEVRPYSGVLDSNGTWETDSSYGAVWYPQVSADWQPYSDGYYSYLAAYGWCWVGATPWSWPTHHYGRWGQSSGRWFWQPDRRWSPAWVAWSLTPGAVSWRPLSVDAHMSSSAAASRVDDRRRGWTTAPAGRFAATISGTRPPMPGSAVSRPASTTPLRSPTNMRVAVSQVDPAEASSRPIPRSAPLGSPTRAGMTSGTAPQAMPTGRSAGSDTAPRSWSTPRSSSTPVSALAGSPGRSLQSPGRTLERADLAPTDTRPQHSPATAPARGVGAPARAGGPAVNPPSRGSAGGFARTTVPASSSGRGRL